MIPDINQSFTNLFAGIEIDPFIQTEVTEGKFNNLT